MGTQEQLIKDKPVIDLSFLPRLTMREKEIESWKDADMALGELGYLRNKLAEAERTKARILDETLQCFEEPMERLAALKAMYEGKIATFTNNKKHIAEGWERKENTETGEVTLIKNLEHGGVSIVTSQKIKLNPIKS